MGKKGIPDRWLDYRPIGDCISGTKIFAFKVPLKMNICKQLSEDEWFTPSTLIEKEPRLKTVIDLTNTHRYYDPNEEFRTKGIDHVKILVEGRGSIPSDVQLLRFFNALDHHMAKYADTADAFVGVHCTHGLNRTGYFVCRWMIDRLKMDPVEAIERFNEARGHNIERVPLLDHLKTSPLLPPVESTPCPSSTNDYTSPLSDNLYDEPVSRYRRNTKHRDRYTRNTEHSYKRMDGSKWPKKKRHHADLDKNWRAREDVTRGHRDRKDTYKHFSMHKKISEKHREKK